MDSFYTEKELSEIGFKAYGKNVKISRKASIYDAGSMIIGSNVRIDDFCFLSGHIEIGDYVHIAAYTALYGKAGIFLNDFSNISVRVTILSQSDDYSGAKLTGAVIPDEYENIVAGNVRIEKHVIVGAGSVIMPNITLNEGSAFGCFSFINRDVEAWSINVGIPIRKIKDRKKDIIEMEKLFLENQGVAE